MRKSEEKPHLADQEKGIIRLILQGLSDAEIANRLDVSEGAVGASLRQLFRKLAVRTRAQLVTVVLAQYRDQLDGATGAQHQ
jgi:DNA-binding NarL/FixJ family response regulator